MFWLANVLVVLKKPDYATPAPELVKLSLSSLLISQLQHVLCLYFLVS